MTSKISDLLAAGRANLAKYGWQQGDFGEGPGSMCALGALNNVDGIMLDEHQECRRYLGKVIAEQYPAGPWIGADYGFKASVAQWNDASGRTVDEVFAVYEKAIALAEEAGD